MKKIIQSIFWAAFPLLTYAQLTEFEVRKMTQSASEQQLVTECSRMLQENYFLFAEIITDRLLQLNPQSANYHYRKGYIVLDSRQDVATAMPHLLMAKSSINKNFDMYSMKEAKAPTDVYFHLARCYHLIEQFDNAKEYYQKFLDESLKKSVLIPQAKLGLLQCDVAKELISKPKSAVVENIGDKVNSVYPEYSPVISLDGTSLYFTSRRQWEDQSNDDYRNPQTNQYPDDIYLSTLNDLGEWSKPIRLAFCDEKLNEATVTISADERMIYTYEDRTGNGDIYFSDFHRNEFQQLKIFNNKGVNTKYWEPHVAVSPDGQQMYFVSDRPGGYGKRDIYRLLKLPNGEWSDPINLGPKINTPHDEDGPFIAVDNKTLYFASNGSQSMGGFDIFVSVRDDNGEWSTPINLGYPINSTGDDAFYTTTADGSTGYLTSFRKDGFGEKDIYQIRNDYMTIQNSAFLKGSIITSDGTPLPESVNMDLQCLNCDDKRVIPLLPRLRDGKFFSNLTPCREYVLTYYVDSLKNGIHKKNFITGCDAGFEQIDLKVILDVTRNRIVSLAKYSLDGQVTDARTGEALKDASIEFTDRKTGQIIETLITDNNGYFKSIALDSLQFGNEIDYITKISKKGYLTQNFDLKMTLAETSDHRLAYALEKPLAGIDLAKVLDLKTIYFDLDKADIRMDAAIELDKIVQIMNDNPQIRIEIGSHTDCRSSKDYNLKLSERRAKSSAEYIQQKISNPNRIYGRGYGESQLVNDCECEGTKVSNCSDEEHQQNRRTEFKIIR